MPGFELFGADERKQVNDVLETGILMRFGFDGARKGIWKAKELEATISKKFGCRYTHLVSSGTTALTTVLGALGIGYGDEVIMPTFTFVASFESIISVGALPVLVDVDDTLTLNPDAVRKAITPKTKCVMPVHMCGAQADMDSLQQICKEHNLILLEDACQSTGATYKGKYLGTIGDAGCYSFDFVKIVTCGEGGAIVTNREDVYLKSDGFSDHGHDHIGVDRGADLHPYLGYNYRISELHAAVGLAQFSRLDEFLARQRAGHAQLKAILAQLPEISFRRVLDEAGDSCTFLSWFLPTTELTQAVVSELKAQNAWGGNFYWFDHNWHYIRKWDHLKQGATLNALHPEYKAAIMQQANKDFGPSDAVMSRGISTQISLLINEQQIKEKGEKIVAAVKKVLAAQKISA